MPDLSDVAPLDEVRAEIEEIEALGRRISDLTAVLRARLTPEHFRLAWALRDAVESLAIAEGLLRDRRLAGHLTRHLPTHSAALEALHRRLIGDERPVDETG
jgi:hypothetical protein